MSQRVKDLLDQAVAGIEPRNADPAAAVIRRGRIARARVLVAGGLVLVAVLTGGTVAGARLLDPPPETAIAPKAATRPDRPPNPRLEKGRIVAGDVSVAVPKGWQVIGPGSEPADLASESPGYGSADLGCHFRPETVLVGEGGNPWGPSIYCATAEIEVLSTFNVFPFVWALTGKDPAAPNAWRRTPAVPYRMVTLDGGAPAWLRTDADGVYRVVLPWSRVEVTVRGSADLRRQVLDSLETGRWAPDALVLPKATEYAALTTSSSSDRPLEVGLTNQAKIQRAVELLRAATVVDEGDSCASEDQPTVALEIGKSPDIPRPEGETGTFVITLADGCHEVVSEEGGRVRLDAATLTELGDLFGVRLP